MKKAIETLQSRFSELEMEIGNLSHTPDKSESAVCKQLTQEQIEIGKAIRLLSGQDPFYIHHSAIGKQEEKTLHANRNEYEPDQDGSIIYAIRLGTENSEKSACWILTEDGTLTKGNGEVMFGFSI